MTGITMFSKEAMQLWQINRRSGTARCIEAGYMAADVIDALPEGCRRIALPEGRRRIAHRLSLNIFWLLHCSRKEPIKNLGESFVHRNLGRCNTALPDVENISLLWP